MRFVVLLRGINVGTSKRIEMKRLRTLLESLGYSNVSTYLNSGNALFESRGTSEKVRAEIEAGIVREFGFKIPTLVKTVHEMRIIAEAVPAEWMNSETQKTDVAYLFPEVDSEKTLEGLPLRTEFIDVRYVSGAIFWNVSRANYGKSRLNGVISHPTYPFITVRNVNTARFLGGVL